MTCWLLITWSYTRSYWHIIGWCLYFLYDLEWWRRRMTCWLLITWSYTRSYWHIIGWCLYFFYDLEWWRRRRTRWLLFKRFYTRSYWHSLGRCLYFRYPDDLMMYKDDSLISDYVVLYTILLTYSRMVSVFPYGLEWWCRKRTRWLSITWSYTRSYWHILGWWLYFRYGLDWWRRRRTRWLLIMWFYTWSYWHRYNVCTTVIVMIWWCRRRTRWLLIMCSSFSSSSI